MSEQAIPVTPEQVRQLSLQVAAYQAHFILIDLIGSDRWVNIDVSTEVEREIAQRIVDAADQDLKPIEAKITTTAVAREHVHAIAPVIGIALRQIAALSATSIHLSTNVLSEYWLPMLEDQMDGASDPN